ncbi:hypothetical protein [Paraburkholderia sp. D1E]|uniref:hypothetical protein n=1 Tax=Paraburkholderia sp. D1E TaxID=3461398 RepID=UPI0040466134
MTQQSVMDGVYRIAFDTLVDLLAEQTRREQEQTMMDQMFAKLERLDRPTMIKTLLGSFEQLDAANGGDALDEMVKIAPSKVRDVLCSTSFRYLLGQTDASGNLVVSNITRLAVDRIVQQQEAKKGVKR